MYFDFAAFAIVLAVGLLMAFGKGQAFIMWFITKPRCKKEEIDSLSLCRFIGRLVICASGCVLLWIIGEFTQINVFTIVGLVLLVLIALFGYIYTHTGNRFRKK